MKAIPRDLALLVFSLSLWSLGEGLFLHFQPLYIHSFGADPAQIGVVLSVAGMAMALCHLPAGYIADRFGRKPVMIASWWLGLVSCMIMFLARDLAVFTIGLMLYNATAFVVSAMNSYLTAARGHLSVERTLTLSAAGYGAGSILSPVVGGWLAGVWGLRAAYGVACLIFAVSCVAMMSIASQKAEHVPEGGRYQALVRNKDFRTVLLLGFGAVFSVVLGIVLAPNFLRDVHGLTMENIGLLGSVNAVGLVLVNVVVGRWNPRVGFLASLVLSMLFLALMWQGSGMVLFMLAFFFRAGFSGARSTITSQAGRVVANRELGVAYAAIETVSAAALVLAPLAAGLLYMQSPYWPVVAALGLTVGVFFIGWRFMPRGETPEAGRALRAEERAR